MLWGSSKGSCAMDLGEKPEKAISVLEKWVIEHPENTVYDAIKEKFPGVIISTDGTPNVCVKMLGYKDIDCTTTTCEKCWQMPYDSPQRSANEPTEDLISNYTQGITDMLREMFEK